MAKTIKTVYGLLIENNKFLDKHKLCYLISYASWSLFLEIKQAVFWFMV